MSTAYSGDGITFPDNSVQATAPRVGMVNRIINGDMRISQRYGVTPVTAGSGYTLDRWNSDRVWGGSTVTIQQSDIAPSGFSNSLVATVSTGAAVASGSYFSIQQFIEGYNVADMAWGTASALQFTVSFWVRSSVTGTFGVGFRNSAFDLSYWTTYTVSAANTWEKKSVTIAAPTSGTWGTGNSYGINTVFSLGCGSTPKAVSNDSWNAGGKLGAVGETDLIATTGATFYLTGVQLEKGSTATDFEYVDYGRQLQMCQRYFTKFYTDTVYGYFWTGFSDATTIFSAAAPLPTAMRAQPTVTVSAVRVYGPSVGAISSSGTNRSSTTSIAFEASGSGFTTNAPGILQANNNASAYVTASSEL